MCLIADIGGTNARFALVDQGSIMPRHERTLPCSHYRSLVDAVLAYLDDVSQPMPETAAFAIATPVADDHIVMTNHIWDLSVKDTRKILGLKSLKVLNDFTALALSLSYLRDDDYQKVGRGAPVENQTKAVIGPGTGLGVSGAVYTGEYWLPLQGEGGHVSYGALNDREADVLDIIRPHHKFISAESLVSGPGLVLLYQSIAKCDGTAHELLSPKQIVTRALGGTDAVAKEAVDMFCQILGSLAANLALTLGALGGVFIGGGIVPRLGEYFTDSSFRARFEYNSRFGKYLAKIPTYVITAKYPALIGAAIAVQEQYAYLGVTSVKRSSVSN